MEISDVAITATNHFQYNSTTHLKDHLKKSHDIGTTIKESSQKEFDEILLNLFISSGSPYRLVENPYYSVNQTFKRRI
jgi:hypothetical protein